MSFISKTFTELLYNLAPEFLFSVGLLTLLLVSVSSRINRDNISVSLGILVLFVLGLYVFSLNKDLYVYLTCILDFYNLPLDIFPSTPINHSLIVSNTATSGFKIIVCLLYLSVLILDFYCSRASKGALILMGFSLLSIFLLLSSNEWLFLFLVFESLALSSYCLMGMPGTVRSLEGTTKYFAAGAVSTCLLLLGIFFIFFVCEHTSFSRLPLESISAIPITAFCVSAFLIKVGCAPFHYWVVDAYQGSPATVMVLLATAVKFCMFFLLIKVLYGPLIEAAPIWSLTLKTCAGISIILGCLSACFQQDFKRLLAFSSINNVGYAVAGLSTVTHAGVQASIVYMFFYAGAVLLLFSLTLSLNNGSPAVKVTDLKRLKESPSASVLATLCLFSLSGIPPLSGFLTKFFILSELVNSEFYGLAAIGAFSSIISSYYYVSLIKSYYFESFKLVFSEAKVKAEKVVPPIYNEYIPLFSITNLILPFVMMANIALTPLPTKVPRIFVWIWATSLVIYPLFPGLVYELSGSIATEVLAGSC